MTKFEQAELNELGMSPEMLAERTRSITEQLHADQPNGRNVTDALPSIIEAAGKAGQRRTRSDKGSTRAPKMVTDVVAADLPAPLGAITKQQAAQLVRLAEIMCASHQKLDEARRENHQALHDYCAYVESLTTK